MQEWQETAHTKRYIVDTTSKYSECYFQYENGSSFLIEYYLKTPAWLKVASLIPSFMKNGLDVNICKTINVLPIEFQVFSFNMNENSQLIAQLLTPFYGHHHKELQKMIEKFLDF